MTFTLSKPFIKSFLFFSSLLSILHLIIIFLLIHLFIHLMITLFLLHLFIQPFPLPQPWMSCPLQWLCCSSPIHSMSSLFLIFLIFSSSLLSKALYSILWLSYTLLIILSIRTFLSLLVPASVQFILKLLFMFVLKSTFFSKFLYYFD